MWSAGKALPTIEQLTREFDVARVTVRQAINLLAREGLVSPERGRGTYVNAVPQRSPPLRLGMTLRDLANVYRHDKPQLTLIEQSSATPRLIPDDGRAAPSYHFMRRVHSRNGKPYCVISIYIDQRIFKKASARFRKETIIPVLLDIPGLKIERANQTIEIGKADMDVAQQLGIAVNSPVAEVRRVCATKDGTVVYLGEVTYRGDYIRMEMDLMP